jgi:hypothetical protein
VAEAADLTRRWGMTAGSMTGPDARRAPTPNGGVRGGRGRREGDRRGGVHHRCDQPAERCGERRGHWRVERLLRSARVRSSAGCSTRGSRTSSA